MPEIITVRDGRNRNKVHGIQLPNPAESSRVRSFLKRLGVKNVRTVKSNVMAGFYDEDGQFHPIRASSDYSPSRVGEKSSRKRAKGKKSSRRRKNVRRVRRNIMAGFYDEDGQFHPIRASSDYSPRRVGEKRRAAGRKKPGKRSRKRNVYTPAVRHPGSRKPRPASRRRLNSRG